MGELRLDAQQPLENPRSVNDFIAIQLLPKRQAPRSGGKSEDSLFFYQQLAIRQLANFPHTDARGDAQHHHHQQDET